MLVIHVNLYQDKNEGSFVVSLSLMATFHIKNKNTFFEKTMKMFSTL